MLFGKFVPDCVRSNLRGSKFKLNHIMMQYTLYVRLCLVFSMLLRKFVCVCIRKFFTFSCSLGKWATSENNLPNRFQRQALWCGQRCPVRFCTFFSSILPTEVPNINDSMIAVSFSMLGTNAKFAHSVHISCSY